MPACYNKRTGVHYYGEAVVSLIGIPICETILTGGKCLSFVSSKTVNNDFTVSAVPTGYPAWTELQKDVIRSGHKNYLGQIWVHLKCKKCHDYALSDAISSNVKNHDAEIETQLTETIAARDKMIQNLLEETRGLRATIIQQSLRIKELEQ
jgi:hypothetical protein